MWSTLLFAGTAATIFGMALSVLWHLRWVRPLPTPPLPLDPPSPHQGAAPLVRCSVIVAARDEEARIEGTVRRLLAQRGIDLELIVVDDRSADRTGEILRQLAEQDPRLKIKRLDSLPAGWLGKCHACHAGAAEATGDWILFTDADCWLHPDLIACAIAVADRERADHLTLAPSNASGGMALRAWHLLFISSMSNWFSGVNRDRPGAHLGIGAFNLLRTPLYRRCGGYQALRLSVVDDIKLGLLARRAGGRTRAYLGVNLLECQWGTRLIETIRLLEKNYFAITEFRLWLVILGSASVVAVACILVAGLLSRNPAGFAAALSPLGFILPGLVLARRIGWPLLPALAIPFMFPVFFCALLNSTFVTLRQGGVRWRDTFYPLETLRKGTVR